MSFLTSQFPDTVEISGRQYAIRTDFRTSIQFELLMQNRAVPDIDKTWIALQLYFPVIPEDIETAVYKALWFYACGKSPGENNGQNHDRPQSSASMIYSFEHDWKYIYSAFLAQYQIDLTDEKTSLHWWKFRALFDCIGEDNLFYKIMGYRAMSITQDMPKEQKKYYRKMKSLYRLPDGRTAEEKERDFTNNMASLF